MLVLQIDPESLSAPAGTASSVVLAKQSTTGPPNVAWLVWRPATRTIVTWSEVYGLYAASTTLAGEANLQVSAAVWQAEDRAIYPFTGGRFDLPERDARVPARHYDVRNDSTAATTFGLLQSAAIDGDPVRAPINAAVVPAGETADFTALTTLRVWLQSDVSIGSIVSVPAVAAVVSYDAGEREKRCRYCAAAGRFVPAPQEL